MQVGHAQRIADQLRDKAMAAGTIANEFEIQTSDALTLVSISRNLWNQPTNSSVAPPECEECGFTDFDDRRTDRAGARSVNARPSRSRRTESADRRAIPSGIDSVRSVPGEADATA